MDSCNISYVPLKKVKLFESPGKPSTVQFLLKQRSLQPASHVSKQRVVAMLMGRCINSMGVVLIALMRGREHRVEGEQQGESANNCINLQNQEFNTWEK